MRLLQGLLRAVVMLVRRMAGFYAFVVIIAIGMTAVSIGVKDLMPSAAELKLTRFFEGGRQDMNAVRHALSARGIKTCVYHPAMHWKTRIVCASPQLKLVESLLTFMLLLGKMAVTLSHILLPYGVGCIALRALFDRIHAHVARKRKEAFDLRMRQYPYYTLSPAPASWPTR